MAIPARLSPTEGRKFAFTVGLAFLTLGTIVWWRGRMGVAIVAWVAGGALLVAGLLMPTHLGPVQRAWMRLAHAIARITTPITMGVMYFVVLTPVGALMRIVGKNPLTAHHAADTTWVARGDHRRSDLDRQF